MNNPSKPVVISNTGIENAKNCFRCGEDYAFGRYNVFGFFEECIECMDANPKSTKEIDRVLAELFDHAEMRKLYLKGEG